jgi:hypothetical protein
VSINTVQSCKWRRKNRRVSVIPGVCKGCK